MEGSHNNQRMEKKPENPARGGFRSTFHSLFKRPSTSNSTPPQQSTSALGQTLVESNLIPDPLTSYASRKEAPDPTQPAVPATFISTPGSLHSSSILHLSNSAGVLVQQRTSDAAESVGSKPTPKSRPEDLAKLKKILRLKLEKEEYEMFVSQTTSVQNIAKSLVAVFTAKAKAKAEVPETRNQRRERALVFFEKVAKIGDVVIQHHPDIVALAWAGFRTLLQVAIDNMELKKLLETAEEVIVTALEVCEFYEEIYLSSGAREQLVASINLEDAMIELYAAVIIFCIKSEKYIKSSGILSSIMNTFTAVNVELQTLVDNIEAKGRLLQRWVDIANVEDHRRHFANIEDYGRNLEHLQSQATVILSDMESMREEIRNDLTKVVSVLSDILNTQQKEELRRSRIWLGALESDSEYEKNRKLRTPGTCEWILKHPTFIGWLNGAASIMVIYGIPGAGKSVLQSFIHEKLFEQGSDMIFRQRPPILYFFFKNGNPNTESPITMLATLIDQLTQQYKTSQFIKLLNEARESSNSQQCGSFQQLSTLFGNLVDTYDARGYGPITILIDALDECPDRGILCDFLHYISCQKNDLRRPGVRFLLTSRPEDDIMRVLKLGEQCLLVNLESELVREDIKHFVEKQTAPGAIGYEKLKEFREMLIEILPQKSQGMFRYAALMLDQLLKPTIRDVKKTLNSIPTGLNNMYVWILEHLNDDPDELLLRQTIFIWIAMAFRPLTVYELALAYAACGEDGDDDSEFNPSTKLLINEQDIHRACGALIEIRESSRESSWESSPTGDFSRDRIVSFSHFSVKEFLLLNLKKSDRDILFNKGQLVKECLIPSIDGAHKTVLRACMKQLLSDSFLRNARHTNLHLYSVRYWFEHARDAQSGNDLVNEVEAHTIDPDWQAVCKFMSHSNPSFTAWWEQFPESQWSLRDTCLFRRGQHYDHNLVPIPLHIMACFDLYELFMEEVIYNHAFDKNLENKDSNTQSTALLFAASLGHIHMVKLLLINGANTENENSYGKTPLISASMEGHTEVVKLLLANGADVNNKDAKGWTPLLFASMKRDTETMKLLLANGADVNNKDIRGRTPLLRASSSGYIEVVKLLLANGADVNNKDLRGRTPLLHAAPSGNIEVAKLLLANGADVESKCSDAMTPLIFASMAGYAEVVKLLLANGAHMESKNSCGLTPLLFASRDGKTEVVKLLLANGANMEVKDIYERTSLILASREGHTEVVKLLVANGAGLEDKDNGRTALSFAAENCHTEVVRLLLENGANVRAKDNDGQTAAAWAAKRPTLDGYSIVAKLLEDYSSRTTSELMDQEKNAADSNNSGSS